jgi:hypothetical protein
MRFADPTDLQTLYGLFTAHRGILSHVRQDTLKRRIEAKQCIFEEGGRVLCH